MNLSKNLFNYLILISILLIFFLGIFFMTYYFKVLNNECLADPLVYGAKQYTNQLGYEVIGYAYPLASHELSINGEVFHGILFNSTSSTFHK